MRCYQTGMQILIRHDVLDAVVRLDEKKIIRPPA